MQSTRFRRAAFTLMELLVTMAVLTFLILLVLRLVTSASDLVTLGAKRIDADGQARAVLDRIAVDFAAMIRRTDVDYYFSKGTGNDQFAFYSEATGYYPSDATGSTSKSTVSVVGYRVSNGHLERLSKALVWNGVSSNGRPMVFLPQTLVTTWPDIADGGTDADYQMIGDQVYRLEFCFLMRDGTISDQAWLSPNTTYLGLQDVKDFIVCIAVLDNKSRQVTGDLGSAAAKLPDVSGTNIPVLPSDLWQQQVKSGDLGLSKTAASQVRIYQRYYAVNTAN